jgi:hypothetical protein
MSENLNNVTLDEFGLDPENPRLPTTIKRDEPNMLNYIARTSSINELMTAIGQHGYFPGEPLIVIPSGKKKPKYIVVEGNRRLTALKLLADPTLAPKSTAIKTASAEAKHKPKGVPCILFDKRNEVIDYLGYRHITGIKQWEPLAKARYIAMYFDTETKKSATAPARYKVVALSIGSNATYIKRQLDGMAVYKLMEANDFFDIEDLDEENIPFSLLTTALGYQSILEFVSGDNHPYVQTGKMIKARVKELTSWLFEKNEDGETVIGESRNIKKLALIVESADALKELRAGGTIDAAYGKTKGLALEFTETLVSVEKGLSGALTMVALLEVDDDQTRRIKNIRKQSVALDTLSTSDEK